jgi:HSP20 family protein
MQRVIYLRRPLPGRDRRGLQKQLERAFQSQWGQPTSVVVIAKNLEVWRPPTEVYETDAGMVVRVELAGMRDSEIAITIDDRHLRIEGYRPERRDDRPLCYHQMGINYGTFEVEVFLARPFDAENVAARYDDGILIVELPRPDARASSGPTRVQISEE